MSERDLDAEFARIIACWDEEAPDPQARPAGESEAVGHRAPDAGRDVVSETDRGEPTATTDALAGDALAGDPRRDRDADERPGPSAPADAGPAGPLPDPGAPPLAPPSGTGVLGLPIAPSTPHVWRGSTPQRDDADDLLDAVDADDPDDHFVPPSEIELPSAESDPMFWAIVGGLVGGPLLLLYILFFDREGSGWWVVTALAMIVVGFVLLVLRGGTERDPFDDGTRV